VTPALSASVLSLPLERVPLTGWSAAGFAALIAGSAYLGARRSPWIAFVLAAAIPFAGYRDVAQTTLTVPKCVAFGCAMGLLLSGVNPWPSSLAARRVFAAGLALLIPIAVSAVAASSRLLAGREFFKQAEYLVFFWCAVACIERVGGSARYLTWGAIAATVVVASVALAQAWAGHAPSVVLVNGHAVPRVTGTLEGPNQLAGYFEAALPLLWVAPLVADGLAPLRRYGAGASVAALVLSQSRAGIIMSAVSYALLWRMRNAAARSSLIAVAGGAVLGVALVSFWLFAVAHARWADLERFVLLDVSAQAGGVGTRAQLWPAAIALFRHHPLTGVGAGNFALALPSVGVYGVGGGASSLWLQTLAEQGVIGFAALVAFAWIALRETYAARRISALALAAFLASVSLLAHQLVDYLFFFPKVASMFWLLLGAGVAAAAAPQPQEQGSAARRVVSPTTP
jgi:O-antigen ligase